MSVWLLQLVVLVVLVVHKKHLGVRFNDEFVQLLGPPFQNLAWVKQWVEDVFAPSVEGVDSRDAECITLPGEMEGSLVLILVTPAAARVDVAMLPVPMLHEIAKAGDPLDQGSEFAPSEFQQLS